MPAKMLVPILHKFATGGKNSKKWPRPNIGIPTGRISGLIVLDMDPRNGGYKSRESLAIEHGELAETAEQSTGGGKHLLLRYRNVKLPEQLAPGIDQGGRRLCHRCAVDPQEWETLSVDGLTMTSRPADLLQDVEAGSNALRHRADPPNWPLNYATQHHIGDSEGKATNNSVLVGQRKDWLTSMAGKLRRAGFERQSIEAALVQ